MKMLWILLLLCSCFKMNNQIQQTDMIKDQLDPLSAHYEKGLDVILLKTDGNNWYKDLINQKLGRAPYKGHDYDFEALHWVFHGSFEDQRGSYFYDIYWDTNDHTYYSARIKLLC